MQGWKIFTHSLRMVFGNLGAAFRVSLVLYLAQIAVGYVFISQFGDAMQQMQKGPGMIPPGFWGAWLLLMIVTVVTSLWIAVAWHRYILLEETPGAVLPPFHASQILRYFQVSFLLGLILGLVGLVLGFVSAFLIAILLGGSTSPAAGIVSMLVFLVVVLGPLVYLFYRLSPVLPAAAVGEPMTFSEAMKVTAPASGVIFQLAIIGILAGILLQLPSMMNPNKASLINIVYSDVLGWIYMMVGISILTTIYGHYVQGREL